MLNEVDAAEIKPLAQVNDDTNNLREDEVEKISYCSRSTFKCT